MGDPDDDVTESVSELRRRAEELAVLNDLARRLAALHDTREVLDEVARQARRLLGVDVAYIMLLRADRLRIEVVDGAMGSAMRGIELESGQGLGGQILATGRPLSSERYLEDPHFPHGEGTDAAALSEQLGGILGVPLVVGDDTLGVLLAADRRARTFGARDVELLAGLAAHAALALRTADLFDRERAAAADLRSANETLRSVSESRRRASDLRDVLNDIVIRGEGLDAVVAALERSAGLAVEVRDHHGRTLAGEATAEGGLVVPVDLPSGHGGDLVAAATVEDEEEALRLLRIGATTVAVLMASERSVAEAELRTRGEFIHALLSSDADETSLWRRARAIGVDLHAVTTVAVVDAGARGQHGGRRLRGPPGGRAARLVGRTCATRSSSSSRPTSSGSAQTVARLRRPGRCHPHDGTGRRVRAGRTRCARPTKRRGRPPPCSSPSAAPGPPPPATTWASTARCSAARVGPGSRPSSSRRSARSSTYDAEHQRDLAATLETYLQQARHHARTCVVLHIHPNTLYQRLDRVTEVLGPRWKEPDRALELQVALRLHRLVADHPR